MTLPDRWREALTSPEMAAYRAGLMLPGQASIRASILNDLSTYYHLEPDECVRRCRNWEQWSVDEWRARPRDGGEGLRDFYNTTQSWSLHSSVCSRAISCFSAGSAGVFSVGGGR